MNAINPKEKIKDCICKSDSLKKLLKFPLSAQAVSAVFMLAAGGVSIGISALYVPQETDGQLVIGVYDQAADQFSSVPEAALNIELPEVFVPEPEKLNLAYCFSPDSDTTNVMDSKAGQIYQSLSIMDADWLDNIYNISGMTPEKLAEKLGLPRQSVIGKYNKRDERHQKENPDTWTVNAWKNVNIAVYDGNGRRISGTSNVKEILSMASVFTYFQDYEDETTFLQYAKDLWKNSHSYQISIGDIYYCDGCLNKSEEEALEEDLAAEVLAEEAAQKEIASNSNDSSDQLETSTDSQSSTSAETTDNSSDSTSESTASVSAYALASSSEASGPGMDIMTISEDGEEKIVKISEYVQESSETIDETEEVLCPGHIDLNITINITGITGTHSLFSLDNHPGDPDSGWPGWTEETMAYAANLSAQDWMENYGLTISNISLKNPMSQEEIQKYMDLIPNDTSQIRKDIIRFALDSVGRVPYYWGGKPGAKGYTGNAFGSIIEPDYKGRILKGLDCSGWINWVYWSVTNKRLPAESTTGLAASGTAINRQDLQPGDIIVRLGGESGHVVMFLAWTENDSMICIHESSAAVGNVAVSVMDANWKYYRKLVE